MQKTSERYEAHFSYHIMQYFCACRQYIYTQYMLEYTVETHNSLDKLIWFVIQLCDLKR